MKSPSPAFSFYPKDWLSDARVRAMTLEEKGAYIDLLAIYWLERGLTYDRKKLARMLGISPRRFDRLWAALAICFRKTRTNRLKQKRLDRENRKQIAFSDSRRNNGLRGGRPRKINISENLVVSGSFPKPNLPETLPFPFPSPSSFRSVNVRDNAAQPKTGEKTPENGRIHKQALASLLVSDILKVTNDEQSAGYYHLIAMRLPHETIFHRLGITRDMAATGKIATSAGQLFTGMIEKDAKRLGIRLRMPARQARGAAA